MSCFSHKDFVYFVFFVHFIFKFNRLFLFFLFRDFDNFSSSFISRSRETTFNFVAKSDDERVVSIVFYVLTKVNLQMS